jgi:hypothetical protein
MRRSRSQVIHVDPAMRSRWWRYFVAHPLRVLLCAHRGHPEKRERRIFEPQEALSFADAHGLSTADLLAGSDARMLGERNACTCGFHDSASYRRDVCDELADHMAVCAECRLDRLCATGEAIRRLVG